MSSIYFLKEIMVINKTTCRLSIIALILALLMAGPVLADIVIPTAFYGTVKINGTDAPAGTLITAKINGVEKGSYTTKEPGKYGSSDPNRGDVLLIQTNKTGDIGKTIEFWINGIKTGQTAIYDSKTQQLNLGTTPTGAPTSNNVPATPAGQVGQATPVSGEKQTPTPEVKTALSDEVAKQTAIAPTPATQAGGNEASQSSGFLPTAGVLGIIAIIILIIIYIIKRK